MATDFHPKKLRIASTLPHVPPAHKYGDFVVEVGITTSRAISPVPYAVDTGLPIAFPSKPQAKEYTLCS